MKFFFRASKIVSFQSVNYIISYIICYILEFQFCSLIVWCTYVEYIMCLFLNIVLFVCELFGSDFVCI